MDFHDDQVFDIVVEGWEKSETLDEIPYYINHIAERTSWNHPYYSKIIDELCEWNNVRYTAYRTALKLSHLQTRLCLNKLSLTTIERVWHDQTSQNQELLTIPELTRLISSLYNDAAIQLYSVQYRLSQFVLAELVVNLLLNIFDSKRSGCLSSKSIKAALIIFSNTNLPQKFSALFDLYSDEVDKLSKESLTRLLSAATQIPELLRERSFLSSYSVNSVVQTCFSNMATQRSYLTQSAFLSWVKQCPPILVWLPTLHRIVSAQSVSHNVKCQICKARSFVGLQYRCLKCLRFNICQKCFLTGRTSGNHKVRHPVHEFSRRMTSKDLARVFMNKINTKLTRRRSNQPPSLTIDIASHRSSFNREPHDANLHNLAIHTKVLETTQQLNGYPDKTHAIDNMPECPPANRNPKADDTTSNTGYSDKTTIQRSAPLSTSKLLSVIEDLQAHNQHLQQQLTDIINESDDSDSILSGSDGNSDVAYKDYVDQLSASLQKQQQNDETDMFTHNRSILPPASPVLSTSHHTDKGNFYLVDSKAYTPKNHSFKTRLSTEDEVNVVSPRPIKSPNTGPEQSPPNEESRSDDLWRTIDGMDITTQHSFTPTNQCKEQGTYEREVNEMIKDWEKEMTQLITSPCDRDGGPIAEPIACAVTELTDSMKTLFTNFSQMLEQS